MSCDQPTMNLRFVLRGGNQILQQLWTSAMVGEQEEWQNVPLVVLMAEMLRDHEGYLKGQRDVERDEAVAVKNNLCQQNAELLEDVSALTIERDDALKECLALTIEKDGLQVELDRLRAALNAVVERHTT